MPGCVTALFGSTVRPRIGAKRRKNSNASVPTSEAQAQKSLVFHLCVRDLNGPTNANKESSLARRESKKLPPDLRDRQALWYANKVGDSHIATDLDEIQRRKFLRALLEDLYSLEGMLEQGKFETGVRRIGAEQEMFLVSAGMRPAPVAVEILEAAKDPRLTTELARFNLEGNLSPQVFGGDCLRRMHQEIEDVLAVARRHAQARRCDVLLAGILPTLRQEDLGLSNMTPNPRYLALNNAMTNERGGDFHVIIRGLDELRISHDNVMLESCNTSFQLHLQVDPDEFSPMYNMAQAITAPVLAAAVNSPTLLRRRLWSETRVALFETSVDSRNINHRESGHRPRVFFGDDWVQDSVLEVFRDNISHFRVIVVGDEAPESSRESLMQGRLPKLSSLCLHSGTVYRWNRACYGVHDGVAHLRIENRVLPSGPTPVDEMANAAFYFGLMIGLSDEVGRIDRVMRFDDAKSNFFAAARHGLDAQLRWIGGKCYPASTLILEQLIPIAWSGLARMNVNPDDIDRYLGVLRERVQSEQTGSRWVYDSLAAVAEYAPEVRVQALTDAMCHNQRTGEPVHTWPLATVREGAESWRQSFSTAGQVMSTNLFSVRAGDILDLPANLMDWHQVRHVPVEDDEGRLIGLVSHRAILRVFARGHEARNRELLVRDVMREDPVTASTGTPTQEVMDLMRRHRVSCLPVVGPNRRLVGLVTEQDLMQVSARLLERFLNSPSEDDPAASTDAVDGAPSPSPDSARAPAAGLLEEAPTPVTS